jgi:NAD(P)-dependent dehydrogenase (short-subunit alcohol dehydrogenase family)
VNCVVPGSTDTEMMWFGIPPGELPERRRAEEDVIPLGRLGRPEEIARASLWFCSDNASFATGAMLVVDGGAMSEYPGPRWKSQESS